MCDQDHFEEDRQEYENLGSVTRKQFGIMLGAGLAMMLPQAANAAAVTESDVNVTTPDALFFSNKWLPTPYSNLSPFG